MRSANAANLKEITAPDLNGAFENGFKEGAKRERKLIIDALNAAHDSRSFTDSDGDFHECPGLTIDEIEFVIGKVRPQSPLTPGSPSGAEPLDKIGKRSE